MPIPTNKQQLQDAITDKYSRLQRELAEITPNQAVHTVLQAHSKGKLMSVNNLLAYLIGWGRLVLKWNNCKENSLHVDFPETGFSWNQLGRLAEKFYDDYSHMDYPLLVYELDAVFKQIQLLVQQKTDEQLYGIAWYEKWTLGRMIQFNTSSAYANATSRLRKWKKTGF